MGLKEYIVFMGKLVKISKRKESKGLKKENDIMEMLRFTKTDDKVINFKRQLECLI